MMISPNNVPSLREGKHHSFLYALVMSNCFPNFDQQCKSLKRVKTAVAAQ